MPASPFYVYALKDPRENPARIFYIGKGTGNRAWEHQKEEGESDKNVVISEIQNSGLDLVHVVLASNLTETEALKIEAELIAAFGIRSRGGLLTNNVMPNIEVELAASDINVPEGCYEKSQMALQILLDAVMEFARANKDGVRNGDVAKYLGLQSDYGGGSKDYLSYSLLGLLMKSGQIERTDKKKHIAKTQ
jgi:hypothetical protein